MAESPVKLVKGEFTYKKGEEDKTFDFYANYIKCTDTIQLVIQGYSPTVISAAKDLPLTSVNMPGATFMAIELSRKEYNDFITDVLNKKTQLSVKDTTGRTYKLFPGTWSSKEIPKELPPTSNSASSCAIAGGRRRTRRRKHKRRSTRQRHYRR